jgi:hypothetical protein
MDGLGTFIAIENNVSTNVMIRYTGITARKAAALFAP